MSFLYWVFEDTYCFSFPNNSGYVGISEDSEKRWPSVRAVKKAPEAKYLGMPEKRARITAMSAHRMEHCTWWYGRRTKDPWSTPTRTWIQFYSGQRTMG